MKGSGKSKEIDGVMTAVREVKENLTSGVFVSYSLEVLIRCWLCAESAYILYRKRILIWKYFPEKM